MSRLTMTNLLHGVLIGAALFLAACTSPNNTADNLGSCAGCMFQGQCIQPQRQSSNACGHNGETCAACPADQSCDGERGVCVAVGSTAPLTVPSGTNPCGPTCTGCCNPNTGRCVDLAQQTQQACGHDNQDCRACGSKELCDGTTGTCVDGPEQQSDCDPTFECYSVEMQQCVYGDMSSACGRGGQCRPCGDGQVCINGTCTAATTQFQTCQRFCDGCCTQAGECITKELQFEDQCGRAGICLNCSMILSSSSTLAALTCDKELGRCVDSRQTNSQVCINQVTFGTTGTSSVILDSSDVRVRIRVGDQEHVTNKGQYFYNPTPGVPVSFSYYDGCLPNPVSVFDLAKGIEVTVEKGTGFLGVFGSGTVLAHCMVTDRLLTQSSTGAQGTYPSTACIPSSDNLWGLQCPSSGYYGALPVTTPGVSTSGIACGSVFIRGSVTGGVTYP